jgi:hypothetical protein
MHKSCRCLRGVSTKAVPANRAAQLLLLLQLAHAAERWLLMQMTSGSMHSYPDALLLDYGKLASAKTAGRCVLPIMHLVHQHIGATPATAAAIAVLLSLPGPAN